MATLKLPCLQCDTRYPRQDYWSTRYEEFHGVTIARAGRFSQAGHERIAMFLHPESAAELEPKLPLGYRIDPETGALYQEFRNEATDRQSLWPEYPRECDYDRREYVQMRHLWEPDRHGFEEFHQMLVTMQVGEDLPWPSELPIHQDSHTNIQLIEKCDAGIRRVTLRDAWPDDFDAAPIPGKTLLESYRARELEAPYDYRFEKERRHRKRFDLFQKNNWPTTIVKLDCGKGASFRKKKGQRWIGGFDDSHQFPAKYFEGELLVLGVKDDLSDYTTPNMDFAVPQSRVYIHFAQDKWRMLFCMSAVAIVGKYGWRQSVHWVRFAYCIPVTVEVSECGTFTRTFRGLSPPMQKSICAVPGMCSALAHGLNSVKGQLKVNKIDLGAYRHAGPKAKGHAIATFSDDKHNVYHENFGWRLRQLVASFHEVMPETRLERRGQEPVQPVAQKSTRSILDGMPYITDTGQVSTELSRRALDL